MKTIFRTIYGSRLYGTNIESSDTDMKGVYIYSADDLLLQKVQDTDTNNTNKGNRKSTSEDIDCQLTSLKKFLHDLSCGQTYAVEFLFIPEKFWVEKPDPIWIELLQNKEKLISKNITSMVSYARNQAFKYGEKGKRLDVFQDVVGYLQTFLNIAPTWKIKDWLDNENQLAFVANKHKDFISIHKKENDTSNVDYFDVNGIMVSVNSSVEYALSVYEPKLNEYGDRTKKASKEKGNDLKAQYHAVRIACQCKELLETGKITFPRPEANLLLEIRNGKIKDQDFKNLIDDLFEEVRELEKKSNVLPEKTDKKWINEFLKETNRNIILKDSQ